LIVLSALFIAGVFTGSTNAKIDPKTIVGLWLFDEDGGDTAKDSSGNKNDGQLMGNPKWVTGKFGKALQFDGSSTSVDCGNTDTLDIPTNSAVTMCAWVNSSVGSLASWQGVMAKRTANYSYGINFVTSNFQVYSSSASGVQGWAYNLPKNEWVHIVGTMSKDPTEFYVNGELFGGAGKGPGGGALSNTANSFRIGASGTIGEVFNGIIDEVAIFSAVLTADDIKSIMNKGLGSATGITAVQPLDKLEATWAAIKTQ